jgi:ankyrin repeat protein
MTPNLANEGRGRRDATPLRLFFSQYPEVVTALIKAGADVNAKSVDGRTPLDWAPSPPIGEPIRAAGGKRSKDLP